MTSKLTKLVASGLISAAIMSASSAFAAGTTQGTDITNQVTVNFTVGGTTQTPVTSNTDTFKVDRKVIFTVAERATVGTTTVAPGQQDAIVAYTVSNTSNDTLDFTLTAANLTSGSAAPRGTDNIDASNLEICVDVDGNGVCAGTGAEVWGATATIDNLAADTNRNVLVRGDFGAVTNGQIAGVRLTATAVNSDGSAITASTDADANTSGVETIFADTGRDGVESALDDYTVGAANLTVFKSSTVISDPVSGSNPKAIPGAVVEYCIAVNNASGSATATGVSISDILDMAKVNYSTGTIFVDATVANFNTATQTCTGGTVRTDSTADSDGGSFTGTPTANTGTGTVAGTLSNIAGGVTRGLRFRVVID